MALWSSSMRVTSAMLRRRVAQNTTHQQKRGMALGGHSGPPPEWEGIDKVVRGYFPQDYQLAIAILGGYTGLYVLFKITSAFSSKKPVKKEEPAAVAAAPVTTSGGMPPLDSPDLDKFFERICENEQELKAFVESA